MPCVINNCTYRNLRRKKNDKKKNHMIFKKKIEPFILRKLKNFKKILKYLILSISNERRNMMFKLK